MLLKEPYFMKNREWYWIDENSNDVAEYKLTDKAPKKAKESYKEFYSMSVASGYPPMTDEEIGAGIQEYKKLVAEGKLPPQD